MSTLGRLELTSASLPSCLRAASPAGVYRDPPTPTAVFTLARHVHLTLPSTLDHLCRIPDPTQ